MASSDSVAEILWIPNAVKRFVQSIAFTTSSAGTTLNARTDATVGQNLLIPKSATWVFQSNGADFQYIIGPATYTVTSTNSVYIVSQAQEYCTVKNTDGSTTPSDTTGGTQPVLSLKGATTSGTVQVFAIF